MRELIDLSSLQETVDWEKVAASGIEGAYIKSSQYSGTWDYQFGTYVSGATRAGISCGAYHFAYCGSDPAAQARFFFKASDGLGSKPGELPPSLDLEFAKNIPPKDVVDWAVAFMKEAERCWYPGNDLREAAGQKVRRPIIYTFPYFAQSLQPFLGESELTKYPLWIATYQAEGPKLPTGWSDWALWQWIGNGGQVPGIGRDCDRDKFKGDWDEFRGIFRQPDSQERPAHIVEYDSDEPTRECPDGSG